MPEMPGASAVLLMDLQMDFLADQGARMPVAPQDARRVLAVANQILAGRLLPQVLPVLIVNEFEPDDHLGNLLRRQAALRGSLGSALDPRLMGPERARCFTKHRSSAFSQPLLEPYLREQGIRHLYILGVFAEGCVRATALDARQLGFDVTVPQDAIGSDRPIKRRYAEWTMQRAGVRLVSTLTCEILSEAA